jgi:folate-binding protein YgfZ
MQNEWLNFLENQGAVIEAGGVRHLGDPGAELQAAMDANIVSALTHLGVIEVKGEDAVNFLQSQLTNNVALLGPNDSQLGAYCTPKGRILANFRLFRCSESLCLRLPVDVLAATLERLKKFVLLSKVTLEDVSQQKAIIGCNGPDIEALMQAVCGPLPRSIDQAVHTGSFSIMRVPGTQPRFEICGDLPQIQALWSSLDDTLVRTGPDAWTLLDIQAGLPNIHQQTMEAFLPQMVNLDLLGGVSFTKGCYPGQEIVARTRYLGTLKRRMHSVRINAGNAPVPGTPLYSGSGDSGQAAGTIVESMRTPAGDIAALAVLQTALLDTTLSLRDADGPQLELVELPYSLQAGE